MLGKTLLIIGLVQNGDTGTLVSVSLGNKGKRSYHMVVPCSIR